MLRSTLVVLSATILLFIIGCDSNSYDGVDALWAGDSADGTRFLLQLQTGHLSQTSDDIPYRDRGEFWISEITHIGDDLTFTLTGRDYRRPDSSQVYHGTATVNEGNNTILLQDWLTPEQITLEFRGRL